jgi:hypothetical protein
MNEQPPEALRANGAESARRMARTTGSIATACGVGVIIGGAVVAVGYAVLGALLGFGCLVFTGIFGIAWVRATKASAGITDGPWLRVFAVGWCRPPDGCNYAVFADVRQPQDTPALVIRLPLRREMRSSNAWLCGAPKRGLLRSVALLAESGELLATGRVLRSSVAVDRWRRRADEPSRFVIRPPDDWLPPGGS